MKNLIIFLLLFYVISANASLWNLNYQGYNLENYTVNGKKLKISKGKGEVFTPEHQKKYLELRKKGKENSYFPFQWKLVNLSTGESVDQSKSIDKVSRSVFN